VPAAGRQHHCGQCALCREAPSGHGQLDHPV